jgi:hypothetical protein
MWVTKAIVISFAGAVALVGVGFMRAGRTGRKREPVDKVGREAKATSSLETVGLGLLLIGLIGVAVDLAG